MASNSFGHLPEDSGGRKFDLELFISVNADNKIEITKLNDRLVDYVAIEMHSSILVVCAGVRNVWLQFAVPKRGRFTQNRCNYERQLVQRSQTFGQVIEDFDYRNGQLFGIACTSAGSFKRTIKCECRVQFIGRILYALFGQFKMMGE